MSALLNATLKSSDGILIADATTAPVSFTNGLPFDDLGALAVDTVTAINHHYMGLPFTANGRLAIVFATPTRYGMGAAPFNADGRLCFDDDTPNHYIHAVPYTATSAIQAVEGAAPEELVRDPTFGDQANWAYDATWWAVDEDFANQANVFLDPGEGNKLLNQVGPDTITLGDTMEVTFTVSDYVVGQVYFSGGGVTGTPRTANGTYTETLVALANGRPGLLAVDGGTGTALTVTNFSVLKTG